VPALYAIFVEDLKLIKWTDEATPPTETQSLPQASALPN
jgi:hypothetical protein